MAGACSNAGLAAPAQSTSARCSFAPPPVQTARARPTAPPAALLPALLSAPASAASAGPPGSVPGTTSCRRVRRLLRSSAAAASVRRVSRRRFPRSILQQNTAVPTARGGLESHTPRSGLLEGACARGSMPFVRLSATLGDFRRQGLVGPSVCSGAYGPISLKLLEIHFFVCSEHTARFSGEPPGLPPRFSRVTTSSPEGSREKRGIWPKVPWRTVSGATSF